MNEYKQKYDEFMTSYNAGSTSGEGVGEMVAILAQHYCNINMELGKRDGRYAAVYAERVDSIDEATGKPISVAKAEALSKATEEYKRYQEAKMHLQNIEQCINSLKTLQKGILNEYSHVSSI